MLTGEKQMVFVVSGSTAHQQPSALTGQTEPHADPPSQHHG